MKRKIAILLSFVLLFSLVGCNNETGMSGDELQKLYETAVEKYSAMKDMDATGSTNMKITAGEVSIDMKVDMKMIGTDITSPDNMKYYIKETGDVLGQSIDMDIYYEDGYMYMNMQDTKVKSALKIEDFMKQYQTGTDVSAIKYDFMKEVKAKKDGDNTILTFELDENKIGDYTKDAMGQMGDVTEDLNYKFTKASGETTINKDGYIVGMKIVMAFSMTVEGQNATMEMDMDLTYNNPGQPVEMPAFDTEGYTETDPVNLGIE